MIALRGAVDRVTGTALRSGALQPLTTALEVVEDGGVRFVVHVLTHLEHKAYATADQKRSGVNPFLPPDPELFVADLTETHLCVLNKFNVIGRHLLVVTRAFAPQEELLDLNDFEALALCLSEVGGLGFYNSNKVSGASQGHKHLQLVPLPLGPGPEATPLDTVLDAPSQHRSAQRSPALAFTHVFCRLSDGPMRPGAAPSLLATYQELLRAVGISDSSQPYNLLVTERWMLLVPRRREHFQGISVNALGFAGSLLVPDQEGLELIRTVGPMQVLREVAGHQ